MSDLPTPISPRELAVKWLDITVGNFADNLRKLRVVRSGALLASFRKEVIGGAQSDELKLRLSYALYGKFIDMGVGRGMGQGIRKGDDGFERLRNSRGRLRRQPRQPRPWYSTEIARQTYRLAELMLELRGRVAFTTIADALPAALTEINL